MKPTPSYKGRGCCLVLSVCCALASCTNPERTPPTHVRCCIDLSLSMGNPNTTTPWDVDRHLPPPVVPGEPGDVPQPESPATPSDVAAAIGRTRPEEQPRKGLKTDRVKN